MTIILQKIMNPKCQEGTVFYFFCSICIIMVLVFGYTKTFSPGPLRQSKTVVIQKGARRVEIAALLKDAGIIDSPHFFHFLSRVRFGSLKAGEYTFYSWISLWDVLKILNEGRVVVHSFRVPEGLSSFEIIQRLNATQPLSGYIFDIPPEGALLPSTYFFHYGDDRRDILNRMERAMSDTLKKLWAERDPNLFLESPEEALILASIVEKETWHANERRRIAGIFINRLKAGMILQADPTLIYGLTQGRKNLGRALLRSDLKKETPYNTYLILGLPPTPICNPGKACIEAVLHPLPTTELYFISDGQGRHHFSSGYKKHAQHHHHLRTLRKSSAKQQKKSKNSAS